MPTRMINPAHGAMDVYSTNDVDAAIKNGWHVETDADRAAFAAEIARKSGAGEPPAEEVASEPLIDSLPLGDMNIIYKDDAAPQRAKRGPKPKAK